MLRLKKTYGEEEKRKYEVKETNTHDNAKIQRLEEIKAEARAEADRNFAEWRKVLEDLANRGIKGNNFVEAYHNLAEEARAETMRIGIELNKLQRRVGRQREANRKLQWKIKELEAYIKKMREEIHAKAELQRKISKILGTGSDRTDSETVGPAEEPKRYSTPEYGPGTIIADRERPEVQGAVDKAGRKAVRESLEAERERVHEANAKVKAEERLLSEARQEKRG